MAHGTRWDRLARAWRIALAAVFAIAAVAGPVLAFAQGTGSGAGGGGGGGAPGGAPPSGAPGGTGSSGGTPGGGGGGSGASGLGWIVVLLAIAVAIWLFTRRRGGQVRR